MMLIVDTVQAAWFILCTETDYPKTTWRTSMRPDRILKVLFLAWSVGRTLLGVIAHFHHPPDRLWTFAFAIVSGRFVVARMSLEGRLQPVSGSAAWRGAVGQQSPFTTWSEFCAYRSFARFRWLAPRPLERPE